MNYPLEVVLRDNKLVISIGISELCHAVETSGLLEDAWNGSPDLRIVDELALALDAAFELTRENDDGCTPVHSLLGDMATLAIENGSAGVK